MVGWLVVLSQCHGTPLFPQHLIGVCGVLLDFQLVGCPTSGGVNTASAGWLVGCLFWESDVWSLVGWLAGYLVGWLAVCFVSQLFGCWLAG